MKKSQATLTVAILLVVGVVAINVHSWLSRKNTDSPESNDEISTTDSATTTEEEVPEAWDTEVSFRVFGKNDHGQLSGKVSENVTHGSVTVTLPSNVLRVYAGRNHTLALTDDGKVLSWGDNKVGQLGYGTERDFSSTPKLIENIPKMKALATTNNYSLALAEDGTVWSWGSNFTGQLGDGTNTNRQEPKQISGLSGIKSIAAGHKFSVAVTQNGNVFVWGASCTSSSQEKAAQLIEQFGAALSNLEGGYYDSSSTALDVYSDAQDCISEDKIAIKSKVPIKLPVSDIKKVSVGYGHAVLLTNSGKVLTFGCNYFGQLGHARGERQDEWVTDLQTPAPIVDVSAGSRHTLLLDANGTVYGAGANFLGQLGYKSAASVNTIEVIAGLPPIKKLHAGFDYSLAEAKDGTLWMWGSNQFKLLSETLPLKIDMPTKLFDHIPKSIGIGGAHIIFLN